MPIIRVTVIGDHALGQNAAKRLAEGAGRILHSAPGSVWVRIEQVLEDHYAENAPEWPRPLFLHLLLREGMVSIQPGQVEALCDLAHTIFHVPAQQIHLIVEPPAAGRMYFGGVPV
jgi:phenylpyruvate tautomerase PptA (4-oxalocrotonate tautomerase family)